MGWEGLGDLGRRCTGGGGHSHIYDGPAGAGNLHDDPRAAAQLRRAHGGSNYDGDQRQSIHGDAKPNYDEGSRWHNHRRRFETMAGN